MSTVHPSSTCSGPRAPVWDASCRFALVQGWREPPSSRSPTKRFSFQTCCVGLQGSFVDAEGFKSGMPVFEQWPMTSWSSVRSDLCPTTSLCSRCTTFCVVLPFLFCFHVWHDFHQFGVDCSHQRNRLEGCLRAAVPHTDSPPYLNAQSHLLTPNCPTSCRRHKSDEKAGCQVRCGWGSGGVLSRGNCGLKPVVIWDWDTSSWETKNQGNLQTKRADVSVRLVNFQLHKDINWRPDTLGWKTSAWKWNFSLSWN